jgi:hypothetical protein
MAQCLNCKTKLSCGCQKRVAKDGKQVCSNCVTKYNSTLLQTNTIQQKSINLTEESKNTLTSFREMLNTKFKS